MRRLVAGLVAGANWTGGPARRAAGAWERALREPAGPAGRRTSRSDRRCWSCGSYTGATGPTGGYMQSGNIITQWGNLIASTGAGTTVNFPKPYVDGPPICDGVRCGWWHVASQCN